MDPAAALDVQILSRMRDVRVVESRASSHIQQLYRGSVVFITGGTGFLGKQLIEKLLRACNGIQKIYLLMRCKKGKTIKERLSATFTDPVFDLIRKINPDFESQIIPIEGDIMELKLGINDEAWQKLTDEVNFIFHVAATVLFNEPIKSAIITNVRGAREVITLARECRSLKSIVHVSTAYSHCNRKEVEEKFYPSPVPPATIIEMVQSMEEKRLDAMTPGLTESWPNIYTFSKAVAEEAVRLMGDGLPICVVRPSIVTPSCLEPTPGWLDRSNVFGPSGIVLGCGIGLLHTLLLDPETCLELVPVDYVNNLIIASSWDTAKRFEDGERDIKIYTCSRYRNKISWGRLQRICETDGMKYLTPKTIWYPGVVTTKYRSVFLFLCIIFHFIPALVVDGILIAMRKKFRISEIFSKAYKLNTVLAHFLFNSWDYHDKNTLQLYKKLSKDDKGIFNFDISNINNESYMLIWWLGLRKYILKDGLKGTEKAIKRKTTMKIIHYVVAVVYSLLTWKVLSFAVLMVSFCCKLVFQNVFLIC